MPIAELFNNRETPSPERGSFSAALMPDPYYEQIFHDPDRIAQDAQAKGELAAAGFHPFGMDTIQRPAGFIPTPGPGGYTPEEKAQVARAKRATQTQSSSGQGDGMSGAYGALGGSFGGGAMRDLQTGATSGLQGLFTRDTAAARKAMEDALYAGQEEGINTAADRARAAMLEGTFGRGVGSSSILLELAGRGEQEHSDALARARREAFTQAGAEDRADMASQLGLYTSAGSLATTALHNEAQVALANLAREQQESQFGRNLEFQGGENALNRAQSSEQFGQNIGLSYAQLGQQGSQFSQNLAFQGGENALNRALTTDEAALNRAQQTALAQGGYAFTGEQNQLTRDLQQALATSGQTFAGEQNQLSRDLQRYLSESGQTFTGEQNQLTRDLQQALATSGQTFAGEQNQLARDLQRYLSDSGQTFTGQQNQLSREQQAALAASAQTFAGEQNQLSREQQAALAASGQTFSGQQNQAAREQAMNMLLLQIANSRDIASDNQTAAGVNTGIAGVGALLSPFLQQWIASMGSN
jgi:hypothetical protein